MVEANILQEKITKLQELVNRKKTAERELYTIEKEINTILGEMKETNSKYIRHSKNSINSLNNYIVRVMAPGAHMSIKMVAEKILEAGYETTNTKFNSYLHTIFTNRDDIRKVSHGIYTRVQKLIQKGNDDES